MLIVCPESRCPYLLAAIFLQELLAVVAYKHPTLPPAWVVDKKADYCYGISSKGTIDMDIGFLYFIIGCVLFATLVFLVVRLNTYLRKKHPGKTYESLQHDTNHPARISDPSSLASAHEFYRRNPVD